MNLPDIIIRVEPWPWQERPRQVGHSRRRRTMQCPTCGGIRNVSNRQCSKCYQREYRKAHPRRAARA